MMWSTIANFKENLNQIALEVHDDAEELEIYRSSAGEDSPISDRRSSHRFAQAKSPLLRSPIGNGIDPGFNSEIEQYKTEIQRLQSSEAEIKALSVNYAALLKEKEDQLSKLHEENGSLKKNLEATNASQLASKSESIKTLTSNRNVLKGGSDLSPSRQHRLTGQVNSRSTGNHMNKVVVSKQDTLSNGSPPAILSDANIQGNENELADLLEEKRRSLGAMQASYDSEIKHLQMELDKERDSFAKIQLKLNEERKLNGSFQQELLSLRMDKDKNTSEMNGLRTELDAKISEIRRLQSELTRRDDEEEANEIAESFKRAIATLEQENTNLKMEKGELEIALRKNLKSPDKRHADDPNLLNMHLSDLKEVHSSIQFPEKEETERSIQKLDKDLKEACQERDKALQELTRLKKHLLDKELEESEKMDEDSKIIEELQANCDYQRSQILHLEKALKQAIAGQEDMKKINGNELQKSKEMIIDLKQKLAGCMSTIDAKNTELLNLQTALGQYYAESEAKERLEGDLCHAREESAKLSELLKDANQRVEVSKREKDEILAKLSQAERMLLEGKHRLQKLEEDNLKLRRALEQSMTRLNRMSVDSDYFVDRRIVIKLLVTYILRNHSEEVLDLMVRMLGFSEEDKQRIGMAQQGAGKGVVRGVLGIPGRLVGGILGGSSAEASHGPSENQSFADLWVDFLLKETEERERREFMEATGGSKSNSTQGKSPSTTGAGAVPDYRTSPPSSLRQISPPVKQSSSPFSSRGNLVQPENSDTEFSTVPLSAPISPSSENSSRVSKYLPRY